MFITVFKTIESFRGEAKFSTWLLRIAANHSKNRIKHLARRPTEGVDPEDVSQVRQSEDRPAPPVQAHIDAPDKLMEAAEIDALMQRAIADLDEDQRLLVVSTRRRGDVVPGDRGDYRVARRHDKIAAAPRAHGDQGRARQTHAVA